MGLVLPRTKRPAERRTHMEKDHESKEILFRTISSDDWKRELGVSRLRRAKASERIQASIAENRSEKDSQKKEETRPNNA